MNVDLMQWESVQYAAMNPTGQYIAIAGRRGLAHYSTVTNRWKLFGNEVQEQSFAVTSGGILWEANLDVRCLYSEPMADIVITMTSLGGNLLIFTGDNVLRFFSFHLSAHASYSSVEVLKKAPIVILKCGELSELRELTDGGWEHLGLSDKIEFFWISRNATQLATSLWAMDGSGVKLWINFEKDRTDYKPEEYIRMNTDFYVLCKVFLAINFSNVLEAVMLDRGVIFGVDQRLSTRSIFQCPIFRIETKV
ncbi:hypothetical protein HK101_011236 [Irineochytrium annulatum]|nr:hypothetical protein HK101_011236 [Irineochytrium annulatum]